MNDMRSQIPHLAAELRESVKRGEIVLTIVEAMKDGTKFRGGWADPLVGVEKGGQEERKENIEVLRDHMETRLGDRVLRTSLEDWDEQEDYNWEPGCRLGGMRLALMILRRNMRENQARERVEQENKPQEPDREETQEDQGRAEGDWQEKPASDEGTRATEATGEHTTEAMEMKPEDECTAKETSGNEKESNTSNINKERKMDETRIREGSTDE